MRLPCVFALALGAASPAAAACDLPALGPVAGARLGQENGRVLDVVTGVAAVCDPASRSFAIDLPDLHGIEAVQAQLTLAGFSRRYGVHQIGFVLQSVTATPTAKGVNVAYGAAVDGLDRYQLAYTLFITAKP
jgi:hypothetical protein